MSNQNVAAPGAETFVHGTVLSVMFNTNVEKRGGGTYPGTTLFYQSTRGEAEKQSWAQQIIDDARNIEIRNALIALQAAPGAAFTLHKVKNDKGYWNVTRIDMGHVEGNRTTPAAAPAPAGGAPSGGGGFNDSDKMRSKEQCMRGEAIQAAASVAKAGGNGQVSIEGVIQNAEIFLNYITNGLQAPVAAPAATPVAAPAPAPAPAPAAAPAPVPAAPAPTPAPAPVAAAPAPVAAAPAPAPAVAPAPLPTIAPAPVPQAPAPAPAPVAAAPAPAAPPVAAAPAPAPVVAQPAAVPDGF